MPAVAGRNDDESKSHPQLFNIANRGLCLMTKSGSLQAAGDCSIVLLGSARSSQHNLKGYVFGLKFYPSRSKEVGIVDDGGPFQYKSCNVNLLKKCLIYSGSVCWQRKPEISRQVWEVCGRTIQLWLQFPNNRSQRFCKIHLQAYHTGLSILKFVSSGASVTFTNWQSVQLYYWTPFFF